MLPRSLLALLLIAASAPTEAHCYKIWKYHTPQMCGQGRNAYKVWRVSALPQRVSASVNVAPEQKVIVPTLEVIDWGEPGDERFKGIVLLRALGDGLR
jgi:hypothetical protein